MAPVYSLVLPVFNEEAVIPVLLRRLDELLGNLDAPAEIIFVDDGSATTRPDRSRDEGARGQALSLSAPVAQFRPSGRDLDRTRYAAGQATIVMDADLQDPPEVVLDMIAKWKEGFEIVYAERLSRAGESRFKRRTADLFYLLVNRLSDVDIPRNVGDFRLVDRKALDAFLAMPERDRFVRGMFAWIGFRQAVVRFHRPPRTAGETKYSLAKMARLAVNGVVSFSDAPLRLALWAGVAVSSIAILYGLFVVAMWAMNAPLARGWSSIVVIVSFLGGANMLMTGLLGLYVGRIYSEVKRRPLYVLDRAVGFEAVAQVRLLDKAEAKRA